MSKKKKYLVIISAVIAVVFLAIIGTIEIKNLQDQQVKFERQEKETSIKIQTQVANRLYRHYRLFTVDQNKFDEIKRKYDKDDITADEFFDQTTTLRKYVPIEKVKFTNIYIDPMGGINLDFIINDIYEDDVLLGTIVYEINDWTYNFNPGNEINNYVLDEKERPTFEPIPKDQIIYYRGRFK